MIKKFILTCIFSLLPILPLFSESRGFDNIFPNMPIEIRNAAFQDSGYFRYSDRKDGFVLISQGNSFTAIDPQIINSVLSKNPSHIVESLLVIQRPNNEVTLLEIYNALGNIRGLKGRLYFSNTRNKEIPLFEDATRVASEKSTSSVQDPPPASIVPFAETVYIRLKDANFGNTYYRGEMSLAQNGMRYRLTNYKNITYFLIPAIKEEKFFAQLYFEPIQEGVLIYCITGVDVSDFISSRIHIGSAISKRLEVIISWVADGIKKTR